MKIISPSPLVTKSLLSANYINWTHLHTYNQDCLSFLLT